MVAVNYQNRALWQQANDFKTRFIKKKKLQSLFPWVCCMFYLECLSVNYD